MNAQIVTKVVKKWFCLGALFSLPLVSAQAAVDLGRVQVSTIGHYFALPIGPPPAFLSEVRDDLVRQSQDTGGGAVVPSVSANFDTNNKFVLTLTAPPGQEFVVHVPAGQSVYMSGSLDWQGPNVLANGPSEYGTSAVSFGGLTGAAPDYSAQSADLSELHGFFGFNNIQSVSFTNDIAFTSITLTATVPDTNVGSGLLNYTPSSDDTFVFYYVTAQTNDPGRFVSIEPIPPPPGGELLTFDDLPDLAILQNGYGGLDWHYFDVLGEQDPFFSDGYRTGLVSPSNVVYNPDGEPASISSTNSFDLISAYLTAAVLPTLQVEVQGFVGTTLTYDNTYALNTSGPNFITFNYLGVDLVKFIPKPMSQFAMDNLSVVLHGPTNVSAHPPVDLGVVQVSTTGHTFTPPLPPDSIGLPGFVTDSLVDQRQGSGGGGVVSSVSVNFDTNNQFVLTITAPPGKKFLVHVPAGQPVFMYGQLDWQGPNVLANGPGEFGTTAISFAGLMGVAPGFSGQSADLSKLHGFFGFNNIQSVAFTNDFAFSSITLTATVPDTNVGSGLLNYTPSSDNALVFYYPTYLTNDPGSFVSVVFAAQPVPGLAMPTVHVAIEPNGDVTLTFTGILQWASQANGPFTDVPGNPQGTYTIPKASLGLQQHFRARQ